MTTPWRLAKSLDQLRKQINAAAPNRKKGSDGTIGDSKHASTKSDHNPDKDGVVKAMDITHDPSSGVDGTILTESLVASRDPRVQYIIWNRGIWNGDKVGETAPWTRRAYRGANPHDKHIHISVRATPKLYDDQSQWGFQLGAFNRPVEAPKPRPAPRQPQAPQPPVARPQSPAGPIPDPEDALVEPDARTFWQWLAEAFLNLFRK